MGCAPPDRTIGTTPSGLLICLAYTRVSAPAAQPRALWQNPVGIPGGKTAIALPSAFPNGEIGQRPPTHAIPNAKGVVPYSPGLRRPRRYPGYEDGLPFNANGVVPKHRRFGLPCSGSVAIPKTNHHVAHSAGFVNPRSTIPELGHGTTPSGLSIWLAFTRGSAPAAQPRALWQNPVGIPGGKTAIARPSAFPNGEIGPRLSPQYQSC